MCAERPWCELAYISAHPRSTTGLIAPFSIPNIFNFSTLLSCSFEGAGCFLNVPVFLMFGS
jgi:hypothetical protein